jgi:hypothetical protein
VSLETPTVIVFPLMFTSSTLPVGVLTPGSKAEKQIWCWSATRKNLDLEVMNDNPLVVWKATRLNAEQCKDLEGRLRGLTGESTNKGALNTRVLCGYRLNVTVYEQKDGKQFDQGPFASMLSIRADGRQMASAGAPTVTGTVQGDVQVGGSEQKGRIDLGSFPARTGVKRTVLLWGPPALGLKIEKYYPTSLNVELKPNSKDSTTLKKNWELRLQIAPGSESGSLPENSIIILETQSTPPRHIRIPVVGNAVQG